MAQQQDEMEKSQLHFRIDPYLKKFLKEWAKREGVDMTTIVIRYLRVEWEKQQIREEIHVGPL